MITIETLCGDDLHDVLEKAVLQAPARFEFNAWTFETVAGDSLESAKQRFHQQHGFKILTHEESIAQVQEELEATKSAHAEAIDAAGVMTEQQMRDMTAPTPRTKEELLQFIGTLVDRPQDYGTCVYAISLAATAAYNFVANHVGATGFQASVADMDIIRRTRRIEWFKILDYDKLLYPQYCTNEHFPSWESLLDNDEIAIRLGEKAASQLESSSDAHKDVVDHWKVLVILGKRAVEKKLQPTK